MRIEILYLDGCPNHSPALGLLRAVLAGEGLHEEVIEVEVRDESVARKLKFFGSPTIRVNGLDIEVSSRQVNQTGLACRCYLGGLPSEDMIRTAVREARGSTV